MAAADAFGGTVGNICDADFSDIMGELGLSVSELNRSFELSYTPVLETMEVYVDDEFIPQDDVDGWRYAELSSLLPQTQLRRTGSELVSKGIS